jgi:hypothetical protein
MTFDQWGTPASSEPSNGEDRLQFLLDESPGLGGCSPSASSHIQPPDEESDHQETFLDSADGAFQLTADSSTGEGTVDPAILSLNSVSQAEGTREYNHEEEGPIASHGMISSAAMKLKCGRKRHGDLDIERRAKGITKKCQRRPSGRHMRQPEKAAYLHDDDIRSLVRQIRPKIQSSINVGQMVHSLTERIGQQTAERTSFFIHLLFAVAHPTSIRQLRDVLEAFKSRDDLQTLRPSDTIAGVVQRLDLLDVDTTRNALLRRFYLLRLFDLRDTLRTEIKEKRAPRGRERRAKRNSSSIVAPGDSESGKVASAVLSEMMKLAYPSIERPKTRGIDPGNYWQMHKSLQNRLFASHNWHLMRQKFTVGVIALVPTGGQFNIHNQR